MPNLENNAHTYHLPTTRGQHDVDNLGILRPVTKLAIAPAADVEIERVLRRAVRLATTAPYGPVAVEIPVSSCSVRSEHPRASKAFGSHACSSHCPQSDMMGDAVNFPQPAAQPQRPITSHSERTVAATCPLSSDVAAMARAAPPLCAALRALLAEKSLLVCDPGPCSGLVAALENHHRLLLPPQRASVGYAVPTAIGAALYEAKARSGAASASPVRATPALLAAGSVRDACERDWRRLANAKPRVTSRPTPSASPPAGRSPLRSASAAHDGARAYDRGKREAAPAHHRAGRP